MLILVLLLNFAVSHTIPRNSKACVNSKSGNNNGKSRGSSSNNASNNGKPGGNLSSNYGNSNGKTRGSSSNNASNNGKSGDNSSNYGNKAVSGVTESIKPFGLNQSNNAQVMKQAAKIAGQGSKDNVPNVNESNNLASNNAYEGSNKAWYNDGANAI
jgi:hypothetical protein